MNTQLDHPPIAALHVCSCRLDITPGPCSILDTTPRTLLATTPFNEARSRSTMLSGVWQAMPALLYMVSNLEMVKSTAFETSTKAAFGPSSRAVSGPHLSECLAPVQSKISRTFETSSLRIEKYHFSMMYS